MLKEKLIYKFEIGRLIVDWDFMVQMRVETTAVIEEYKIQLER